MMNSLDMKSILLDASQNGAYFFVDHDADALVATAEELKFFVADISLQDASDKVELMERLASGLHIPSWFGGNWDGLADVLRDLSWLPPSDGYLIVLRDAMTLRDAEPEEFNTLLDVANEAAFIWSDDGKPFWVLLPMPEDELPEVDDE